MGLGEENEPPKKKLKQAQLSFAPKTHKRKLVSDDDDADDDDVQILKIIRKEPNINSKDSINDKENVLSPKNTFSLELEKKQKLDVDQIYFEKTEVEDSGHESKDCDENTFLPPQDFATPKSKINGQSEETTLDLLLSISDSTLDEINKSQSQLGCNSLKSNETSPNESSAKNSSSPGETSKTCVTDKFSDPQCDQDVDRTINSDDGDTTHISYSNEDSPDAKVSPIASSTKLTPRRLESIRRKEELQRLKLARKAERARRKEEKIRKQEAEKRRKKEEKEKRRLEDQKQKEEEKKVKEEERKKKDEEKKQKEEEKKKKEEEKRVKEEEKKKKEEIEEKKKAAFAKFFKISKQPENSEKCEDLAAYNFMPFPMKPDLKLACQSRRYLNPDEKEQLDCFLENQKESSYLNDLKDEKYSPRKSEATWPLSYVEEEHDVIIIESTTNGDCVDVTCESKDGNCRKKNMKAKLLQFHDNRRPPYWGTWRKKSTAVCPRRPFGQDKVIFDYEVDSDSEWEEEVEGEDIEKEDGDSEVEASGDEEEGADENGYILDNTFVPHGYLSDEEVHPDEDLEDNEPENQKLRMKLLKQEFDEEMKSKTERLKPRLLGIVWISNGISEVSSGSLYERLMTYRTVWNEEAGSPDVTGPIVEDSPTSTPQTKKVFPQSVLSSLVTFVHGCNLPLSAIIKEFLVLIDKEHPSEHVSKRAITLKVKEIASKTYSTGRLTWTINSPWFEEFRLKPINEVVPPPMPPAPPVLLTEKPKESSLMNFFNKSTNSTSTPPPRKKVPLISLPKSSCFDYTPSKINEHGVVKDFGTPRPTNPILKKRATLITLSRSVEKKSDKKDDGHYALDDAKNSTNQSNVAKNAEVIEIHDAE